MSQPEAQSLLAAASGPGVSGRSPAGAGAAAFDAAFSLAVAQKRFVCRRQAWCAGVAAAGWRVIWLADPIHLAAACDSADIVIAPRYRGGRACGNGTLLIGGPNLRLTGALEIASTGPGGGAGRNISITPAVVQIHRPWNRHRLYDWRSDSFRDPERAYGVNDSDE